MKRIHDVKITAFIAIFTFIAVALVRGPDFQKELWDAITTAVSITLFGRYLFIKWLWKALPLEWLHGVPHVEGDWKGNYFSTWKATPDGPNATGPVDVNIVQPDIFTFKVRQQTGESISYSYGETLEVLQDGSIYLNFSYRNDPKATVRNRSQISYGTARYLLARNAEKTTLAGNYFTDRKSTGEVEITLQ